MTSPRLDKNPSHIGAKLHGKLITLNGKLKVLSLTLKIQKKMECPGRLLHELNTHN